MDSNMEAKLELLTIIIMTLYEKLCILEDKIITLENNKEVNKNK